MNFSKSLLFFAVTSLLFTSCKENAGETKETETATEKIVEVAEKPETASFSIEGMTCSMGCAKAIEKELAETKGVQKATVDFEKKTAIVEFDAAKQTPEKLMKIVEATADGKTYKASGMKTSDQMVQ